MINESESEMINCSIPDRARKWQIDSNSYSALPILVSYIQRYYVFKRNAMGGFKKGPFGGFLLGGGVKNIISFGNQHCDSKLALMTSDSEHHSSNWGGMGISRWYEVHSNLQCCR